MTIDPTTCDCRFHTTCIRDARYVRACEQGRGPKHATAIALAKLGVNGPVMLRSMKKAFHSGPGTELKKLLSRFGIGPKGCGCNARAAEMDQQGAAWCRKNIETIADWLAEQAKKRKLPFTRLGAKLLIRWAIRRAESQHG